jgi:hypothetical protein
MAPIAESLMQRKIFFAFSGRDRNLRAGIRYLVHGVKRGFWGVSAIWAVERKMSCTILVILG